MAEVLQSFEFKETHKPSRYPWDEWCDGRIWKVTQGVDFHIKTVSFRQNLAYVATRRKLRLRTRIIDNTMVFQFVNGNHNESQPRRGSVVV